MLDHFRWDEKLKVGPVAWENSKTEMYLYSSMKVKESSFFLSLRSTWVLYVELIGPETLQRLIVPDTQSLGKCWISVEQYGLERSRIFLFTWFI